MESVIDAFEVGFNRIVRWLAVATALSIGLITLLIPLNLFLVKTKLGGLWWLFEGVEYALYFGVFLSAPWVLQQGAHVRVDVLVSALPDKASNRLDLAVDIASSILCAGLCVYGVRAAIGEYEDGTLPDKDLRIANWIVLSAFAGSFLMLAIEFLFRLRGQRRLAPSARHEEVGF